MYKIPPPHVPLFVILFFYFNMSVWYALDPVQGIFLFLLLPVLIVLRDMPDGDGWRYKNVQNYNIFSARPRGPICGFVQSKTL